MFLVYVYPKLGDLSENITKYYLSLIFFMPIYFQEISKDGKKLFVKLKDFGALKISYILALSLRGPPVGFTNCDLRICVVRMDGWVVIRRVLPFWSVFCIITRVLQII